MSDIKHPAQLLFTADHPLTKFLDMEFEAADGNSLIVHVSGPASFADADGEHVHTGFNTLFLDTVMGCCAIGELKKPQPIATTKLTCNHLGRAKIGEPIRCKAVWDGENNSIAYVRGEVFAGEPSRMISHAVGTFMIGTATKPLDVKKSSGEKA